MQKTPEFAQAVLDRSTRETVAQASRQGLHRFGDAGLWALETVRLVRDHDGKVARGEIIDVAPDGFEARDNYQGELHQHARKECSSMTRNVLTDVQVAAIVLLQDPLLLVATVDLDVKVTPLSGKDED